MNADGYAGPGAAERPSVADPVLHPPPRSRRLRDSLPLLATVAWLVLLGWLIWRHVRYSEQPVIGDARAYWLKARNFWALVAAGSPFNPFNVDPNARPPGTVLMSYPFGFAESTKGLIFRSVFFPIALMATALHVAGSAIGPSAARRIDLACVAAFVCAAPLFYHFEYAVGSPTYWGLVDCFIAGAAAVAMALALYAVVRSSKAAALGAAVFASICFATKPSGLFVMALTGVAWVVIGLGLLLRREAATGASAPPRLRPLVTGLSIYALGVGVVVVFGRFFSDYFSTTNIAFGTRALDWLREDWLIPSMADVTRYLDISIGRPLLFATTVVLLFGLSQCGAIVDRNASRERRLVALGACGALIFLVCGAWFWLIYTGGSQVRYVYPFVLPVAVLLTPAALTLIGRLPPTARVVLRALLLLPALNITVLLMFKHPPPAWEAFSHVNIGIHDVRDDLAFADRLLQSVRASGRSKLVYEEMSGNAGVVESVWGFELVAHPTRPNVQVIGPLDSQRTATYRLQEISDADFLLFAIVKDPEARAKILADEFVPDYGGEQELFRAWFSSLDARDGVRPFAESSRLRLLEIVDHAKFEDALQALKRSHRWRTTFIEANPKVWWTESEILARPDVAFGQDGPVTFGGKFEVRAVAVETAPDLLTVRFFWRSIATTPTPGAWHLFVHGIDAAGQVLTNAGTRMNDVAVSDSRPHYRMQSVEVPLPAGPRPATLAVGIYLAEAGRADTLPADRGPRDWGDRRLLIPLAPR